MTKNFVLIGLAWLFLGEALILALYRGQQSVIHPSFQAGLVGFFVLWALSIGSLFVMGQFVGQLVQWMGSQSEKKTAHGIQMAGWGISKLVCLGLFIIVLLKGQQIPFVGLFLGIGTMGIVPLVVGLIWSQKVLKNA